MVVFTCTHCGESLQKPKVEKHYQFVCRSSKSLTCVDCLKDFRDEEYTAHTKCITEEERYSAKGSTPSGIMKKGEVKQESWTDLVKTVVDNAGNVPASQKRVLDVMGGSVNVPRKKSKFINFIKSSTGGRIKNEDIEAVWNMMEQYKISQAPETKGDDATEGSKKRKVSESASEAGESKKKRKSKDLPEQLEAGVTETTNGTSKKKEKSKIVENVTETNEVEIPEKKSKKKSKEVVVPETNVETTETKPKKKKKKSKDAETLETNTNVGTTEDKPEKENEISEAVDSTIKSKKKRKSKQLEDSATANDVDVSKINVSAEIVQTNGETVSKKKRKSKDADTSIITEAPTKPKGEENVPNVKVEEINGSNLQENAGDFSFEQQILYVLKSKNTISVEKLQKKVLGAYCKKTNSDASPKTIKKFNKKLKKMTDVEIKDNTVKLIAI